MGQVHLEDPAAEILAAFNIACEALFAGQIEGTGLALAPTRLVISGEFVYDNCSYNCTLTDLGNGSFLLLLKTGPDLATVSTDLEIRLSCPGLIACTYTGDGLSGHAISAEPPAHAGGVSFPEQRLVSLQIFADACYLGPQLHLELESSTPFYVKS